MGVAGVSEFVDKVDADVDRRVKAYRVVAANDVVIYRAGHRNAGNAVQGKVACASERAVAADNNNTLNAELFAGVNRFLNFFLGLEFGTTRTSQKRAASAENVADISCGEFLNIALDKSLVSLTDTHNGYVLGNTGSDNGSDSRVHALSVASARQYADGFHDFIIPFRYTEII